MSDSDVANRAAQARSFLEAARLATEFATELGEGPAANVAASNAVLAGIAAADAICGRALRLRSSSGSHTDAITLLKRAHGGEAAAKHLSALIAIKSMAAYEPLMVSQANPPRPFSTPSVWSLRWMRCCAEPRGQVGEYPVDMVGTPDLADAASG